MTRRPDAARTRGRLIFGDVTATVGGTPMVTFARLAKGLPGRVVAKLEMRNPCGSVKDRLGVVLIRSAEDAGALRPGMTLVEPTGGNTGIGLAFVAAIRGYRLILTMPESMSSERVALLRQFGAKVVLTPGNLMGDAAARARQRLEEIPDSIMLDQFSNPMNPRVAQTDHRPGDLEGHGGRHRRLCFSRGHRRYDHRGRGMAQGAQAGDPRRRRRARGGGRALGRHAGEAPHAWDRCGLHTRRLEPLDPRRNHHRDRTRRRSTAAGGLRVRKEFWPGSPRAPRSMPRWRWPLERIRQEGRSWCCWPTRASATSRRASSLNRASRDPLHEAGS